MRTLRSLAARWYSLPFLLLAWHFAVSQGLVRSRLLPDVTAVWSAFLGDLENGVLPYHAGVTIARAMIGFAMALVAGVVMAAIMARSALIARLVEPMFLFGYPVPKIALFPLFGFVFGVGNGSKVAFTFLECVYPVVLTTYAGISAIRTQLIWSAENFGASRMTVLLRVVVPAAMPAIFAGMRIALPVALTVVIVTEMIGDTQGLGYYITIWSTRYRYANVYAGMLTIALCGLVLDRALMWLRGASLAWTLYEAKA